MHYADKCCNGVRWKKSTKSFMLHEFTIIANTCYNIKNDCYKVGKTYKFKINERGKVRNIRPLTNIEAESRDTSEIEHLAKGGPISYADYYVFNNGSIDEYHKNLERILNDIEV